MEFRKKIQALGALIGKGDGQPNPIREIIDHPEKYRLEAYFQGDELVVKIKPNERKIVGYKMKEE